MKNFSAIHITGLLMCCLIVPVWASVHGVKGIFATTTGKVEFKSDAPLELIEAASDRLKGVIDSNKNAFAFSIQITSFQGFNSALQKEHFNEKFMESELHPEASFQGKIIEDIDYNEIGYYKVRAKGILSIHGVSQERIIRSDMHIEEGKITIDSDFKVLLADHRISIPKIVSQKISEEIQVHVRLELLERNTNER